MKKCNAFCLAHGFDLMSISKASIETNTLIKIINGVLLIENNESWSVVFSYGAVIHWNVTTEQQATLHQLLLRFADQPLELIEEDHFTFSLNQPFTRIIEDHIDVESDDSILILSLSHGMAQSIKLAFFETNAITTINNTKYIPKSLAKTGSIKLSRQNIAKTRGQLFLTKSDIILHYDLLDTPDFFWENPEYNSFYHAIATYLEIAPRTEVLSKKLETIHELFEMLADEQKHRHSLILEWIIIWLIVIEIAMTVIDKIF